MWVLASLCFLAAAGAGNAAVTAFVSATANPPDGGTVSGSGTYTVGRSVTLNAKANKNGWAFSNWSDGTNTASRKVLVPSNGVVLTANFAITTGILSFSATNLDMGNIPISLSASQEVSLVNSGPGAITIKKLALPKPFKVSPTKFTMAAGATQKVYVTCLPRKLGEYRGTLAVSGNAARMLSSAPVIRANVLAQTRLVRLDGDLTFGSVLCGQTATRPLKVCNDGNSPLSITSLAWSNNTATALIATPNVFTVPAGTSVTVNVSFAPQTPTDWNATLLFTIAQLTGGSRAIAVTGMGTLAEPGTRIIRLAGDLNFGEHFTDQPVTRPLTVYNDGDTTATVRFASWTNNGDASFGVLPPTFSIAPGSSTAVNVCFTPRAGKLYTNVTMVLNVANMTSGDNGMAVSGGANAWGHGTWVASLSVSDSPTREKAKIAGEAYVWQDGTNVVAEIKATYDISGKRGSIDDVFRGTVQNRSNFVGICSSTNTGSSNFPLILWYVPGATATGAASATIISGVIPHETYIIVATFRPRTSTNNPSLPAPPVPAPALSPALAAMIEPPVPTPAPSTASAAMVPASAAPAPVPWPVIAGTPPSLTLTVLTTADGGAPACAPDGCCAMIKMRAGVATVVFPDGIAPLTSVPQIVVQTVGADDNANGLPDALDAALGFVPAEGTDLLTVRELAGWLLLETPYIDKLRIQDPAVPSNQLPATWQVTPVVK